MIPKILKFCSLLIMVSPALASRTIQVSTTILDGFGDDLNIHPFTKIGQKLYYFGQKKVTWYKAFLICRSLGGFLASLRNYNIYQIILLKNIPLKLGGYLVQI
ncbi:uncharacterized protein ACRADG_007425 [Cochliomyia hominivorax]